MYRCRCRGSVYIFENRRRINNHLRCAMPTPMLAWWQWHANEMLSLAICASWLRVGLPADKCTPESQQRFCSQMRFVSCWIVGIFHCATTAIHLHVHRDMENLVNIRDSWWTCCSIRERFRSNHKFSSHFVFWENLWHNSIGSASRIQIALALLSKFITLSTLHFRRKSNIWVDEITTPIINYRSKNIKLKVFGQDNIRGKNRLRLATNFKQEITTHRELSTTEGHQGYSFIGRHRWWFWRW